MGNARAQPPAAVTLVVVSAINGYQRFISPYKGFRCAHRALHGRASCSEFAKCAITRCGLPLFPFLLCRRFKRCAAAADELSRRSILDPQKPSERMTRTMERECRSCEEDVGEAGCCFGVEMACSLWN